MQVFSKFRLKYRSPFLHDTVPYISGNALNLQLFAKLMNR
jgi:hypothetical protein